MYVYIVGMPLGLCWLNMGEEQYHIGLFIDGWSSSFTSRAMDVWSIGYSTNAGDLMICLWILRIMILDSCFIFFLHLCWLCNRIKFLNPIELLLEVFKTRFSLSGIWWLTSWGCLSLIPRWSSFLIPSTVCFFFP